MSLELLDAAIGEVKLHRHSVPVAPDAAPDPVVFDSETLGDLLRFLRDARRGTLTAQEVADEARMWQQLVDVGWPAALSSSPVERAVAMLAQGPCDADPVTGTAPLLTPVPEPVNELERALALAVADDSARPLVWQALHDGELVLPLVAHDQHQHDQHRHDQRRPEGLSLQFLSTPTGDDPLVFGFAAEERFNALLPAGSQVSRVLAPGRDLPRIWPEGHWLMINAGYENGLVLSPWEVTGLPHGGRTELPHPRSVDVAPPRPEDEERAVLLTAATATVAGCTEVVWARLRRRGSPDRAPAPWRDVLVVAAAEDDRQAEVVQALGAALPPSVFPEALVVGRHADLVHPLVEKVVATGRVVSAL